jgi:hypothetical protein
MHLCMSAEHQARRCPNSVLGRLQVIELAAAVHQLNQDKCQLENQMEMEEVAPAVQASCHDIVHCVQAVTCNTLYAAHCHPFFARTMAPVHLLCRRKWSTGCSGNWRAS